MAGFFDEKDVVKKQSGSFFDENDTVEKSNSQSFFEEEDTVPVDTEAKEPLTGDFWMGKFTQPEELDAIAKKRGVDPNWLKEKAGFLGVQTPEGGVKEFVENVGNSLGEIAMGVPQKLYIASQDENKKLALEDVRELAKDRRSWATAISEGVANAGLLGGVKILSEGKLATQVAANAVQGAVQGWAEGKDEDNLSNMAIQGTIGGAAPLVLKGAGKVADKIFGKAEKEAARAVEQQAAEETIKDALVVPGADIPPPPAKEYATTLKEHAENIITKSKDEVNEFLNKKKWNSLEDKQVAGLKKLKSIINEDPVLKKFASQEEKSVNEILGDTSENIQERWTSFNETDLLKSKVARGEIEKPLTKRSSVGNFAEIVAKKVADARTNLVRMSNKLGGKVNLVKPIDDFSEGAVKKANFISNQAPTLKKIVDIEEELAKHPMFEGSQEKVGYFLRDLKHGKMEPPADLLPKLKEYADLQFSLSTSEDLVAKAEGIIGADKSLLKNGARGFYTHETVADAPIIMQRLDSLGIKAFGKEGWDDLLAGKYPKATLDKEAGKELMKAGRWLGDLKWNDKTKGTSETVVNTFDALRNAMNIEKLGDATAIVRNTVGEAARGEIPNILLETNPARKVLARANVVSDYVFTSRAINRMQVAADQARALGSTEAAEYLERLIPDIRGGRRNTWASNISNWADQHSADLKVAANRTDSPVLKNFYELLATGPDLMQWTLKQAYPNFLGASPRATIANMTQPFTLAIPEMTRMNPIKAIPLMAGALRRTAMDIRMNPFNAIKTARAENLIKQEMTKEQKNLMRSEFARQYKAIGYAEDIVDKATNLAMKTFEFGEAFNRLLTKNLSIEASIKPQEYLHILPKEAQIRVTNSINKKEIQEIFQKELIGSTMFNYDKANTAEFVRDMGPLFGMFSRWPTAMAGKLANEFLEKGAIKGGTSVTLKYLAPLALLQAGQQLIDDGDKTERSKALFGSMGLAGSAPITSIVSLATGDFFSPPVLSEPSKAAKGLIDGKEPDKVAADLYYAFGPMGWIARLINKDIPRIINNEELEK